MGRIKMDTGIGAFHKKTVENGLTYAEAQMQETREIIGKVRAPKGEDPDEMPYQRVSARNALRKIQVYEPKQRSGPLSAGNGRPTLMRQAGKEESPVVYTAWMEWAWLKQLNLLQQ